ncbi:MAG: murein biosynthesis integral membrane protein MurJ [Lentisphaeraceae bacterium]|nr:murein biosynthesis integral membrane protein MurJ [Lentisphaeraceae bacterium]
MSQKKEDNLSSSAIKSALGNFASRISGLLRDICFALFFGTSGAMSAFITALTIPNLSRRIFGEGALTASFIPLLSDKLKNEKDTWAFASTILSVTTVITSILGLLGIVTCVIISFFVSNRSGLILTLTSWLLPFMIFICLSAQISGILNLLKSFTLPAISSVFLNLFLILGCILSTFSELSQESKIYFLVAAVLISGVVQLVFLYRELIKKGASLKWSPDFKSADWLSVKKLFLPGILGASVAQLSVMSDRIIALWIGDHAVSALYYSERLTYFPVGIFAVALGAACLPFMSKAVSNNDHEELMSAFSFGIRQVVFLTIPCSVLFFMHYTDIMNIIYKRGAFDEKSLADSAHAFMYYLPGIPAFSAVKIILPLYYANKNVSTPVKISLVCLTFNLILGISFIPQLSHGSLAMATSVSSYLNIILLLSYSGYKDIGKTLMKALPSILRIVICSLISAWALQQLNWQSDFSSKSERLIVLLIKIAMFSSLFLTLHITFGGKELKEILLRKKINN